MLKHVSRSWTGWGPPFMKVVATLGFTVLISVCYVGDFLNYCYKVRNYFHVILKNIALLRYLFILKCVFP